jgi:phospholipid/cholesterol/gamma-HCH transport system permease protein
MLPAVVVFADAVAIAGGYVVSTLTLGLTGHVYVEGLKLFFYAGDVFGGLFKSFFFGMLIATMGCFHGFRCRGGAEGVGRATIRAVVDSCVFILVLNYLLGVLLFRVIFA